MLQLGDAGFDVGSRDPHRQLNASKNPTLPDIGIALGRDCNTAMRSLARQQPKLLAGRARRQIGRSDHFMASTSDREHHGEGSAWIGGHLCVPYEQNTQQWPAFGYSIALQRSHS
ncbi:MAG: hypothetical protein L6Q69_12075 [Zoogloea sp.]|nr:hypothetical protein [Zoogloea sp.]